MLTGNNGSFHPIVHAGFLGEFLRSAKDQGGAVYRKLGDLIASSKGTRAPEVFQVEIDVEGKKARGIIRELQQHPVTDKIQHVDFLELTDNTRSV